MEVKLHVMFLCGVVAVWRGGRVYLSAVQSCTIRFIFMGKCQCGGVVGSGRKEVERDFFGLV